MGPLSGISSLEDCNLGTAKRNPGLRGFDFSNVRCARLARHRAAVAPQMVSLSRAKCSTLTPGADRLSWKTRRYFRRMLRSCALAAYAHALKDVDTTDLGEACSCACPQTPSEEKQHEGEQ